MNISKYIYNRLILLHIKGSSKDIIKIKKYLAFLDSPVLGIIESVIDIPDYYEKLIHNEEIMMAYRKNYPIISLIWYFEIKE